MKHAWINPYLATPYQLGARDARKGWDCMGLIEVLQPRHYGFAPRSSRALYPDPLPASEQTAYVLFRKLFRDVFPAYRAVERMEGAAVLFRSAGSPIHAGLYLGDGLFLHCRPGPGTCVGNLNDDDYRQLTPSFHVPD